MMNDALSDTLDDRKVLFTADTGDGVEYFVADAGGVTALSAVGVPDVADPEDSAALGDRLVFTGHTAQTGDEPWITDGTPGGTRQLADIGTGPDGSFVRAYTTLDDRVLFWATSEAEGAELWSTDGTPDGTDLVIDLDPGAGGAAPVGATLVPVADGVIFPVNLFNNTRANQSQLWFSDGTEAGTRPLIEQGDYDFSLSTRAVTDDSVYFFADDMLWVTDGTQAGTRPIAPADVASLSDDQFVASNGLIYFAASDVGPNTEPWVSDGTAAGTQVLADLRDDRGSVPLFFVSAGDRTIFSASDNQDLMFVARGVRQPWTTDGTPGSVTQLTDSTGADLSGGLPTIALGDQALLIARRNDVGSELFITDGTPAGTELVKDIATGSNSAFVGYSTKFIGDGSIVAFDIENGELWVTDGTEAGTVPVAATGPGSSATDALPAAVFGAAEGEGGDDGGDGGGTGGSAAAGDDS
jgi:ELWxxDGT repeat protein